MVRPASKFVAQLSDADRDWLLQNWKSNPRHAVRRRAHAILLSNQRVPVSKLAEMLFIDTETAYSWIDRWNREGRAGLEDEPRSGAPPKLNQDETQRAVDLIEAHPSEPRVVLNEIAKQTGKSIGRSTLRRIARNAGLRWKRLRKSLKQLRDPKKFEVARQELAELTAMPGVNVAYFDEATFSLSAVVPYGWQPIGERISIQLSGGRQAIHVLAVEDHTGRTTAYLHRGSINGSTVVSVISDFTKHIRKTTVLVLDNASPHTCRQLLDHKEEWEQRGLILYPLPPYSPELNQIEHLWQTVKYSKLPISAWESVKSLIKNLTDIFRKSGRTVLLPSLQPH